MTRIRLLPVTGAVLSLSLALGGCSALGEVGDREMTAYFPRARSFYESSKVKIMGVDVGRVDTVENEGDRIKVTFHIRRDVPLARGVKASIVPLNLIGERNLVLSPAWKPGQPKETGDTIPIERTQVPVETDDALESFTKLADALDPTKVQHALGRTADSFRGNGKEFNAALEQGARLTTNIAGQDEQLMAVAQNLNRLAGVVRGREQLLGEMIRDFGDATQVLGAERQNLQSLVRDLVVLSKQGDKLLAKYEGQLPYDVAVLTRVALMLKGNTKQLELLLEALPGIGGALINGYDPATKSLKLRFATDAFLRTWLKGIQNDDDVPCPLPPPNSNCPFQK